MFDGLGWSWSISAALPCRGARESVRKRTLSYLSRRNSSFIACFKPLNPQSPFSGSSGGMPRNSSIASSGSEDFICLAL